MTINLEVVESPMPGMATLGSGKESYRARVQKFDLDDPEDIYLLEDILTKCYCSSDPKISIIERKEFVFQESMFVSLMYLEKVENS